MCYNLLIMYTCRHRQVAYRVCPEAGTRHPCDRVTTTTHDIAAVCKRCREKIEREYMGSQEYRAMVEEQAAIAREMTQRQGGEQEQGQEQGQTQTTTRSRRPSISVAAAVAGEKIGRARSGWKRAVRFGRTASLNPADGATQMAPHADAPAAGNPRRVTKDPHFTPPMLPREEKFRAQQPTSMTTPVPGPSFAERMKMQEAGGGRPSRRPVRTLAELEARHTPTSNWSMECGSEYEENETEHPAADDAQQTSRNLPSRGRRPIPRRRRSHRIIIPRPAGVPPLSPASSLGLISDGEDNKAWKALRSVPPVERTPASPPLNAADHLDSLLSGAGDGDDDDHETDRDDWSDHSESAALEERRIRSGPRRGRPGSVRGAAPPESEVASAVTGSYYRSGGGATSADRLRDLRRPCSPSRAKYTFFGGYESD